jgi:tryptophan-rich sensory protein
MSDDRPTSGQGPSDDQPAEGQAAPSEYPGYASAPSPYSSAPSPYPSAPAGGAPAAAVPQPPSVRNAVRLMWVGAAISLISLVVTLATLGSLKQQIRDSVRDSGQNVTQSQVDAAFAGAIVFSVVIALIAVGLWLWMAWKNGQGRQWARIVATVLGVLNVIFTLLSFVGNRATAGAQILSVIDLVIAVAILVLLWRKESTDFYRARSTPQYT